MDKKYYCEYIEKGVFTVEDIFYSIKNFEFLSLYLGYNDDLKDDLYLYSWTGPKSKIKGRDGNEVEVDYGTVYIGSGRGDCIEVYTKWGAEGLRELIDKYYTDGD